MRTGFEIRYIHDHVEVYDRYGDFCFSADTRAEAERELEELAA